MEITLLYNNLYTLYPLNDYLKYFSNLFLTCTKYIYFKLLFLFTLSFGY